MERFLRGVRRAAWVTTALVLGTGASVARADAPALRAYWPLDERAGQTVHDASGNANHGQLGATASTEGSDPSWVDGWLGGALRFEGDDFIQIPDSPTLETPPTISVAAYFRGPRSPGDWRYLVSKGSRGCREASYGLYTGSNGGLGFYISSPSGHVVSPLAGRDVWDGKWHHAVGTFDGQALRLFVDGAEVRNGTNTNVDIAYGLPGETAYLGAYRGGCHLMLRGDLDDVSVWGRALATPEVRSIARNGPTTVAPTTVAPAPALGAALGHPRATCKKPKRSRRACRIKVTFLVHRKTRVRIDVSRLRGRRAKRLGAVSAKVGPPRATIKLPRRIAGRPIARGRYRLTLHRLEGGRARRVASTIGRVR
jgi:hypothetical protein